MNLLAVETDSAALKHLITPWEWPLVGWQSPFLTRFQQQNSFYGLQGDDVVSIFSLLTGLLGMLCRKAGFFPYVPLTCSSMENNSVYHCYRCAWPLPLQDVLWVLLCVSVLSMNIYAIPVPTSEHTTLFLLWCVVWCVLAWREPRVSIWFLSVGLWGDGRLVGEAQVGLSLQCCCCRVCVLVGLQASCLPAVLPLMLPPKTSRAQIILKYAAQNVYLQQFTIRLQKPSVVTFLASKARPNHGLSNHPWLVNELLEDGNYMRGHANYSLPWSTHCTSQTHARPCPVFMYLVKFYWQDVQPSVQLPNAGVCTS